MLSNSFLRTISKRTKSFWSKTKFSQMSSDTTSLTDSLLSDVDTVEMFDELHELLNSPKLQRYAAQDIELTHEHELELELARLTGLIEKSAMYRLTEQEHTLTI
ncbi:hypothetical protein K7432_000861 [Basidiobolus ranarum]|uniref:Uncharacterized protein n=1 Tax=Basidiobolus ranarum TaxID=34480 RepID=A0ABR2WAM9_9FUNG